MEYRNEIKMIENKLLTLSAELIALLPEDNELCGIMDVMEKNGSISKTLKQKGVRRG